jgi:hypothetical protein
LSEDKYTKKEIAADLQAIAKKILAQAPDKPDEEPDEPTDPRVAIINKHLKGNGAIIMAACKATGLSFRYGCALVEQESGGDNVFERGTPPAQWDGKPVTNALVDAMIARPGYKTYNAQMWGVGLVQLTWPDFVIQAHNKSGGLELPINGLVVGFGLLADYLRKYPEQRAVASYNAGEGKWTNGIAYANSVMSKAKVWEQRLNGTPDKGDGKWIDFAPHAEWSKGAGQYVADYPTHYNLRDDVKKLVEKYLNLPKFKGRISACTYHFHPPAIKPLGSVEQLSVDFWDWQGRGFPINDELQKDLFDVILKDPDPPYINWTISDGQMWTDGVGWGPSPGGPPGSDARHDHHIHATFH